MVDTGVQFPHESPNWEDGRAVDCTVLERRRPRKGSKGSNPFPPATFRRFTLHKHSVESNKRANRRHHADSLKKRYKKYSVVRDPNDVKRVGQVLQCPKACSCDSCGNARRNEYAKKERLTVQERSQVDRQAADLEYMDCYVGDPTYIPIEKCQPIELDY
jgi:hypothetical protein